MKKNAPQAKNKNNISINEIEKIELPVDEHLKEKELKMQKQQLKELNLQEKVGIEGFPMLYPIETKEKKWHQTEYLSMVNRLYQPKKIEDL